MKLPIKKTLLFIGLFICSINLTAQDSTAQKLDPIPLNYFVDKFEHAFYFEGNVFFAEGAYVSLGYDFIYNFSKRVRLIPGFGMGFSYNLNSFMPKVNLQFGSKAIRLETGFSTNFAIQKPFNPKTKYNVHTNQYVSLDEKYNGNKRYIELIPTIGFRARHTRSLELGMSWSPRLSSENLYVSTGFQFRPFYISAHMRIYINSERRRVKLGPWKGLHPHTNYEQQVKRRNDRKIKHPKRFERKRKRLIIINKREEKFKQNFPKKHERERLRDEENNTKLNPYDVKLKEKYPKRFEREMRKIEKQKRREEERKKREAENLEYKNSNNW